MSFKEYLEESTYPSLDEIFDSTKLQDTMSKKVAAEALKKGMATFWTKASYSNQLAGNLLDAANKDGLEKAFADAVKRQGVKKAVDNGLKTLIPLNKKAEMILAKVMKESE